MKGVVEILYESPTTRVVRMGAAGIICKEPLEASAAGLPLENRQGRAAFNAQRLDTVMLIAGQLAVSLANAQLYESLEERVQARTRELQETQARLVGPRRGVERR